MTALLVIASNLRGPSKTMPSPTYPLRVPKPRPYLVGASLVYGCIVHGCTPSRPGVRSSCVDRIQAEVCPWLHGGRYLARAVRVAMKNFHIERKSSLDGHLDL